MSQSEINRKNAEIARLAYIGRKSPDGGKALWHAELEKALLVAKAAFEASDNLRDVAAALQESGRHLTAFRQLLAPPCSQDQFALISNGKKISESLTSRGVDAARAKVAADSVGLWLDPDVVPWMRKREAQTPPTAEQLEFALRRVQALLAAQKVQTSQRGDASAEQEGAVVDLLESAGWTKAKGKQIKSLAAIKPHTFMHKAKFAIAKDTSDTAEVDIAIALKDERVAAVECKVTNDETNSKKRMDDVLKKATAWREHFGNFIETVAVLQGVIKPAHVNQLSAAKVTVFWSHEIEALGEWLKTRI